MNPQVQLMLENMQIQIDELTKRLDDFSNASELDPAVVRTLTLLVSASSGKAATSENQAVNEAGSASYSVLRPPDRWQRLGDGNVPVYD